MDDEDRVLEFGTISLLIGACCSMIGLLFGAGEMETQLGYLIGGALIYASTLIYKEVCLNILGQTFSRSALFLGAQIKILAVLAGLLLLFGWASGPASIGLVAGLATIIPAGLFVAWRAR